MEVVCYLGSLYRLVLTFPIAFPLLDIMARRLLNWSSFCVELPRGKVRPCFELIDLSQVPTHSVLEWIWIHEKSLPRPKTITACKHMPNNKKIISKNWNPPRYEPIIIKIFLKTIFIAYCKMALHSLNIYLFYQVEKNLRFNAALVLVTKFKLIPVRC